MPGQKKTPPYGTPIVPPQPSAAGTIVNPHPLPGVAPFQPPSGNVPPPIPQRFVPSRTMAIQIPAGPASPPTNVGAGNVMPPPVVAPPPLQPPYTRRRSICSRRRPSSGTIRCSRRRRSPPSSGAR